MKGALVSKELRRRARQHIERGAVTDGYRADRETVLRILNEALATEIVCVLRYKRHYYMAAGIHAGAVAESFSSTPRRSRATRTDRRAHHPARGGPDPDPADLANRSHSEYVEGEGLLEMIRENLVAEPIVIESYSEMIRYLGEDDPTTRRMLEEILANEEDHADDLRTLLETLGKDERERPEREG